MCFANSLFVAASLLLILPYVRTDSSSTNCTKNQLGKVREKYQTCVQQKLPQMKKSHLAHFTDQKRCQIINTAISKCNPKLVRCFSDRDVLEVTEKQFQVFIETFENNSIHIGNCRMEMTLTDISESREKFEKRKERRMDENRPARYGEKGSLNEVGIGITNMYGSKSTGNSTMNQYSLLTFTLLTMMIFLCDM